LAALAEAVRVAQSGSGEADDLARMTALLDSLEN
jgi:hypothetical protein